MDYYGVIRTKQLQDLHLRRLMLIIRNDQPQLTSRANLSRHGTNRLTVSKLKKFQDFKKPTIYDSVRKVTS